MIDIELHFLEIQRDALQVENAALEMQLSNLREAAQAMVKAFQPGKPSEFAYIARDKLREALEAMK